MYEAASLDASLVVCLFAAFAGDVIILLAAPAAAGPIVDPSRQLAGKPARSERGARVVECG